MMAMMAKRKPPPIAYFTITPFGSPRGAGKSCKALNYLPSLAPYRNVTSSSLRPHLSL